ncbi:MAG: ABC transporter transmembrane domain-containing protein, partial [Bacteroidota bacterium]
MTIYGRVVRYVRPYWKWLAVSMAASVVFSFFSGVSIYLTIPLLETLFSAGAPAAEAAQSSPGVSFIPDWANTFIQSFSSWFRQLVFRENPLDSLLNICAVMLGAFLFKNLFGYFQSNMMTYIEQALIRDLRNDVYRHLHQLPLGYFTNERTGNLISRIMNDIQVINSGISATFYTMIREPLLIVAYLTITLVISWKLTLISFIIFPLALLVIAYVGRRVHRESGLVQERIADLTSIIH